MISNRGHIEGESSFSLETQLAEGQAQTGGGWAARPIRLGLGKKQRRTANLSPGCEVRCSAFVGFALTVLFKECP
jgi:hypothetical protein